LFVHESAFEELPGVTTRFVAAAAGLVEAKAESSVQFGKYEIDMVLTVGNVIGIHIYRLLSRVELNVSPIYMYPSVLPGTLRTDETSEL